MNHNHPSGSVKLGTAIKKKILSEQEEDKASLPHRNKGPANEEKLLVEGDIDVRKAMAYLLLNGPMKKGVLCCDWGSKINPVYFGRRLGDKPSTMESLDAVKEEMFDVCIRCMEASGHIVCENQNGSDMVTLTEKGREIAPVRVPRLVETGYAESTRPELEGDEKADYERLNKIVKEGLSTTLATCAALYQIKGRELYRVGGYTSFEEFALKEHKLKKSTGYQYLNAGRVKTLLDESTDCRPSNEAQVRPLLNVKKDQDVIDIWAKAVALGGTGGVTQSIVAKAKKQHFHLTSKPVSAQDAMNRFTAAARACWDKCDEGDRPVLLGEMLGACADLYDELDQEELTPDLIALFNRIFEAIQ